jgi:hypothetical protein
MEQYNIKIEELTSFGIKIEAMALGAIVARRIASGESTPEYGPSAMATLYGILLPNGEETRVLDTNGDPVWEKNDQREFPQTLEYYDIRES